MEEVTIYQLQDNNGNNIAGLTPEQAVYDQNGVRLPDKLDQLNTQIQSKADQGTIFTDFSTSNNTTSITVGGVTKKLRINADTLDNFHYQYSWWTGSTYKYVRLLTIQILQSYANQPIEFNIKDRRGGESHILIQFSALSGLDPDCDKFTGYGMCNTLINNLKLYKSAESTWELWVCGDSSNLEGTFYDLHYALNKFNIQYSMLAQEQEPSYETYYQCSKESLYTDIQGNSDTTTKLATPSTLWGQSFDGSNNVSGTLSSVSDINMSGNLNGFNNLISKKGDGNRFVKVTPSAIQFVTSSENGFSMALTAKSQEDETLANIAGAYGTPNNVVYLFYGGTSYENPTMVIRDNKIGIGTINPSYKLHIIGNSKIEGSVSASKFIKEGGTSDQLLLANGDSTTLKTINGQTITGSGDITIEGGGDYTLPIASADTLGGIKVGEGLNIDEEGVLSSTGSGVGNTDNEYEEGGQKVYGEIFNTYDGNAKNIASGVGAHAEGINNKALGTCSHVEGNSNIANNGCEHAEGLFNKSNNGQTTADKTIHSIGIGDYLDARKNAVEVMQNGDVYINGVGSYDGTNYAGAQTLQEVVNNKADSIGIVTGSTGEVTQEISPNKFYKFGECSTLTITLGAELPNIYNEYMFQFSSGDTPTVLTLPETVKWIGDSLVDSNKTYQVSIVNNIAVMGGA